MFKKTFGIYQLKAILLAASLLAAAGCQFGAQQQPAATETQNQPAAPPAPVVVDGVRTSYADVVEKTSPAVVRIEAEVRSKQPARQQFNLDDFFNFPGQPNNRQPPQEEQGPAQRGVGSGVIVSPDGTVLTNNHVVEGATKITVLMNDDRTFEAKVVGLDEPSDLAVLKIEGANLPFLNLGNSDNVRVGDVVLAIGNPLGIGQTVTAGIISAKGRRTGLSDGSFEDFLQTDAPINRGNSGGALVNLTGELIGINSQILSTSGGSIGIGFSIPSNMAKGVMEQLVAGGRVRRGQLGVGIQAVNEEIKQVFNLKDTKGVLINDVRRGSAAEKGGVKRDDIIIAINNEPIDDTNVLRNKVAGTLPGTEIKLKVIRDGQEQELSVVLDELNSETANNQPPNDGNRQPQPEKSNESGKLGVNLQPVSPQIARQLGLPEDTGGVVVSDVEQSGAAAKAGIARGDVILTINREPVNSLEAVQSSLEKAGDKPILLLVARRGQTVYLTVRPS